MPALTATFATFGLLSLIAGPAHAQDCDGKALETELAEATPNGKSKAFEALAECDADRAVKVAPQVVPNLLSGDAANSAVVAAIGVGATDPARQFLSGLQSDEKAKALKALGQACAEDTAVQGFFVESAEKMGESFWAERWYTPLGSCKADSVQLLLSAELDKGIGAERTRFFGVLEAFARAQGGGAVPKLEELVLANKDDGEAATYIISAFADAAQVGSSTGTDADAAAAASAAIVRVAPEIPARAVEQARVILQSIDDEENADLLAGVRYKDVAQEDGRILWGTVVVENATCKKDKKQQRVHSAAVTDPGQTWPDQLEEKVDASVRVGFDLDLGEKCRGTSEIKVIVPNAPFADEKALKGWIDETVEAEQKAAAEGAKKIHLDQDEVRI